MTTTKERQCDVCGCTDSRACPEGCCWVFDDIDVCSACCPPTPIMEFDRWFMLTVYTVRHEEAQKAGDAFLHPPQSPELDACPIGLDRTPDVCSAGTCLVCRQRRAAAALEHQHISNAHQ